MQTLFFDGDRNEESARIDEKCEVCAVATMVIHWENGNGRGLCSVCLAHFARPLPRHTTSANIQSTTRLGEKIDCTTWSGGAS